MKRLYTSRNALLLDIIIAILLNGVYRSDEQRMMHTLSWDVLGYYSYLPAFFYDNPATLSQLDSAVKFYNVPGGISAWRAPNGNFIFKYSCGQALLFLPAFISADLASRVLNFPRDGLSLPYQIAINIEGILFGLLGLWLLRKILKMYFKDDIVASTLLIIGLASNYLEYIALDNGFTHNYLFALYCMIFLFSIKWFKEPKIKYLILLGVCCGLSALVRPTEILTVLIPLLWGIHDNNSFRERISFLKSKIAHIFLFGFIVFAVGSIQLIYWKSFSGSWFYFSYGDDQTFSWLNPHLLNVLISYKKGWLIYTPVMILAIIGFIPLYKYYRKQFYLVVIYSVPFFYIMASWDSWLYGGSFSMRAAIQVYPVLAFPISACIEWFSSKQYNRILLIVFVVACTWLNLTMAYQAYFSPQGIIDGYHMNKIYFWSVFGKYTIDKTEKKYLDYQEKLPPSLKKYLINLYFNDFERDTFQIDSTISFSGKKSLFINQSHPFSMEFTVAANDTDRCWYHATAKVYAPSMEWNLWKQSQIIIGLWDNEKLIKENGYRIYRILTPGRWQDISIEIDTKNAQHFNKLKLSFWNVDSSLPLYIDNVEIDKTAK
jgi:hypothetical protein